MIPVVRPAAPAILRTRGTAATEALCAAHDAGRELPEFDSSIYANATVKEQLREAQHRKCAFCESRFDHTGYGDVEHFRPKAGYKQRETDDLRRPGYFWLAYAWENLFYSCQLCNQRFKRNLFPLRDGRRRARPTTRDIGKEQPLLIDPSTVDPAAFIDFRQEIAHPIDDSLEGQTTIDVLGLNRPELAELRLKRLQDLKNLIELCSLLQQLLNATGNPELGGRLRLHQEQLAEKIKSRSEYAAMARAYFRDQNV